MIEVSIIIPVYNTEKYLSKAIESCLSQNFKNIEIIIINDGSTDNSLQIAKEYEAGHSCIRVITTENRGLSEARNTGLSLANGNYIYFLDSDDWIDKNTIEECYNLATAYNLDMVLFDSIGESESSDDINSVNLYSFIRNHIVEPYTVFSGREFIELYADKRVVYVQAWLVFTKREFLLKNNIRFLPNAYYEDMAFHYSCMMKAERIMYIPKPFHVRLYREGSIMNTSLNARKICSVYEIIKEMYFSLLNNGKQYDCLWINYLLHLMDVINRTVLKNVSRKDIKAAKSHYKEITELQRDVIIIYYNLLSFMGEKISNFSKTLEFIDEITTPFGWFTAETVKIIKYIISEREKLIKKIFGRFPFQNENKRIGVYGSGKHAEYILNKYKEMFGDIRANLVFIDTYKRSYSEKYLGFDIININDIHTVDISEIVILSYLYEEDIYSNIVSRYGNKFKIHRIYDGDNEPLDSTAYMKKYGRLQKLFVDGRKRIIYINTPRHTNIGDHMISVAALNFFKDYMPDYDIVEVTNKAYKENRNGIIYRTNVDDVIVITGGGFLGSLWPYSGQNVYNILEDFPDNKIIILPQSVYFEVNEEGERQKRLFYDLAVNLTNITVLLRENISYTRFNAMFEGKVKSFLMPDMALTLNYSNDQTERAGVLLCLRNDKEGILTEEEKSAIKNYFLNLGEEVKESSMHWHADIMPKQREEVIKTKINELKKYKLVVTDALHCMISCAISGTPCIALNNISGKLEGIYKSWLEDIRYIRYVDSYQELFEMDFASWEELNNKNYYNKSFNKEMEFLAKLIMY